ncbi:MAG TPA: hypothetical protein VMV69_07905 [Pirellulales bacterium]|nr:hypothetical protein [Pirellulales bacterium]
MRHHLRCLRDRRAKVWGALVALAALVGGGPASAEEAYQRFLEGLRDRGLFDMALDYIAEMRESPLISTELKVQMPYEEGVTLIHAAQVERDSATKVKYLDRAKEQLEAFIQANPSHPMAAGAETELGQVLVVRGRMLIDQASRPANAPKKEELLTQGREKLTQAQKVFTTAEEKFTARLKEFAPHIDAKEVKQIAARDQARADVLKALLHAAGVLHELAKTYPTGSDESKNFLHEAAAKYAKIYEKYRKRLAGLIARVHEGQCYQDLGDTKRALGLYEMILSQPDDIEEFRRLKSSAMHLSMQCWISDTEKKYEVAVASGGKWLVAAKPDDERSPDGLSIRYYVAVANKLLAAGLKPEEDAARKKALSEAKKQAGYVRRFDSDHKDDAKKLYQELSGIDEGPRGEPTNFVEARDRGKDTLDQWQTKLAAIKMAPTLKDEANIPKYQEEAKELREKALFYFRLALELRDEETPLDDVNIVRYYLCFLSYTEGNYYDAAVMGEFLARNYPDSAGGKQCAKIALASYLAEYGASPVDQRGFDKQRMVDMADYITRRWANQEEADEAWGILMSVAANERQLDKALEYLGKVAPDSPRRGELELKAGQALWAAYLDSARKEGAERPTQEQLNEMVGKAKETLEKGVERMRAAVDAGTSDVGVTLASAALSLGQVDLESGANEKAVALLNDPKIGPMTLVVAKHPATQQGKFDVETYKLALRAYVGTQALDKAEQTMNDLEKLVESGDDENSAATLTKIYITLGRALEEQVTRLRKENKTEELQKVTKGFELFLQRIIGREKGNNFRSLNWVAETFFSLGSGYDSGGGKELSPEAKGYYEKALQADEKLLEAAKADKDYASADALLSVKLRMARTKRRLGQFKPAITQLLEVLKEKPMLIDAQREAALTYQDWGRVKPGIYKMAIAGFHKHQLPDGKQENVIWGWNKLSLKLQHDKKYDDVFHEARYNMAKCLQEQAQSKQDAEKTDALKKAERDILYLQNIRPDMGGPDWRKKYDSLLKTIQKALKKPPTGLPDEKAAKGSQTAKKTKPAAVSGGK